MEGKKREGREGRDEGEGKGWKGENDRLMLTLMMVVLNILYLLLIMQVKCIGSIVNGSEGIS